jgi:hypothetical protein
MQGKRLLSLIYAGAMSLLLLSCGGCASTPGFIGSTRTHRFQVYAPFDNARDWGPSYLVGPPHHQFGEPRTHAPDIVGGGPAVLPDNGPLASTSPRLP